MHMELKEYIVEFPWLRSFITSVLAGSVWFFTSSPNLFLEIVQVIGNVGGFIILRSGSLLIAIISFGVAVASYYNQHSRNQAISDLEEELVRGDPGDGETRGANSITKSTQDILDEEVEELSEWIWLSEQGDVNIEAPNLDDPRKIVLYLIGKRYAYELGYAETPRANAIEISREVRVPHIQINLLQMDLREIVDKYHPDLYEGFNEYWIEAEEIPKSASYIRGDRSLDRHIRADEMDPPDEWMDLSE